MKAILVDDEHLALMQLEKYSKEIPGIQVIGKYLEPMEAIEAVKKQKPDVVFLDIHMPDIHGLHAAGLMQEAHPSVEIVFVTAYDEYAVHAFELHALDYVMKPIQKERFIKTIQRLQQAVDNGRIQTNEVHGGSVLIRCLQTIRIEREGSEPLPLKWRTAKAQELFAYLFHRRGQLVRKSELIETLWPDFEVEKATTHLYTTIYQVRQNLKHIGSDIEIRSLSMKEGYLLDASKVRVDVEEWDQAVRSIDAVSAGNLHEHQQLVHMYTGDYMADGGYLWAENERQRLRTLWMQEALQLGNYYAQQGMLTESIGVFHRMQQQDPYYEESYYALMKLYSLLKERTAVEEQYKRLASVLKELDAYPGEKIVTWYKQWKRPVLLGARKQS